MLEQLFYAVLTGVIAGASGFIIAKLIKRDIMNEVYEVIDNFVKPEKEGMPSPIESYLLKIGEGLALSMRNSLAGSISGDVRLNKAVDRAVGMDALDQSGIGGILDIIGAGETKKLLAKNPQTMALILQRFGPLISQFMGQKGLNPQQQTSSPYGSYEH